MKRTHGFSIARFSLAFGVVVALAASTAVARADAWDKKTTVSFSQAVEVPGSVLQPGRYVMKLVDIPSDRHVVQFMNERENHVYAAAITIPAYRAEVTDKTVIGFYEARAGVPEPIHYWYYPGDNFGQEFVYPKDHLAEIAAVPHETTPAVFDTRGPSTPGPVTAAEPEVQPGPAVEQSAVTPQPEPAAPVEIAQAAPLPAQPEPAAAPQNDPPAAPAELPKTSGNLPEVALLGMFSFGSAVIARKLRRS
jgi:hypothetical protein